MDKIPVTVLTGYLGAGKTTLMNRILSEPHGKKYAVIVNEYGEAGIDGDLIVGADEEIFEMNNGCICCTVRGDLIRVIAGLMKRARNFDGILIETTGLADPGPVAQTFFADAEIAAKAKLDSIVTVVDAYHIKSQLGAGAEQSCPSKEVAEQIAFADIIILNKTDLVSAEERRKVEAMIRGINRFAKIIPAERCKVALEEVLGRGSFDLNEILKHEPDFLGAKDDHHHHHDHDHNHGDECGPDCGHDHHDHEHNHVEASGISSVSLIADQPINVDRFEAWMGEFRASKGPDLLRYKGILDIAGTGQRLAIQGVHMMMEGSNLAPWKTDARRQSRLVFIGRALDEKALRDGFKACVSG